MINNPQNVLSQLDNVPTYKANNYDELIEHNQSNNPNSYYHHSNNIQSNPRINLDAFPMVNDIPYNGYDQNNKLLMEKLNYMIHLLEETHDEQTNNVIEEVILYSFLGIFIIFLIDNFIKVGRYVR
jgi:hypothetical protein